MSSNPRRRLVERQARRAGPFPPSSSARTPSPSSASRQPASHESRKTYRSPERDSLVFLPPADDPNRATVPSRRSSVRGPLSQLFSVSFPAVSSLADSPLPLCIHKSYRNSAVLSSSPPPLLPSTVPRAHARVHPSSLSPPSFSFPLGPLGRETNPRTHSLEVHSRISRYTILVLSTQ